MRTLVVALIATAAVASGEASAQPPSASEFRALASAALGGDVDTIEFTGRGWDACLGQAWAVTDGWARWELTEYKRVIDYATATSAQRAMRRAGLDPERVGGCGGQVGARAALQQTSIRSDSEFADKLPIWLTPHGILRLIETGKPAIASSGDGWEVEVRSASGAVTHRVIAEYGPDYLPRRARTWIDDPVFGDMEVVAEFGAYRDFGGIRFPGMLTTTQGGATTLSLTVDSTASGVAPPEIGPARPAPARGANADPTYVEIGDGVFVMLGSYQAVAVELEEFSVVIDGMQNDGRTRDVIRLTHEAIPDKPIRYVLNTHSHFDHASGLRQYAMEGATILTHSINVPFFEQALSTSRTLNSDPIEPSRVEPDVQGIAERFVIEDDAGQRLEVIPLRPSQHAADMLIAYLPSIRTVVESDLLQPWINPIFAGDGDGPHPYLAYLAAELAREQPDYVQFVPIHSPPEPPTMARSALEEAIAGGGDTGAAEAYLIVPDIVAQRRLWRSMGGAPTTSPDVFGFPGISITLTAGSPAAPSIATSANHVGFSVRDYASYRSKLTAAGASFFYENAEAGQILADLPGGVRIEILTDPEQSEPIAFHHLHLAAADAAALRDWYVQILAAEPGERRGLPSAVIPTGRIDFLPARGDAPIGSRGAAIDRIGFAVNGIDALVTRLASLGVAFERGPATSGPAGSTAVFLSDPVGTLIEISEERRD